MNSDDRNRFEEAVRFKQDHDFARAREILIELHVAYPSSMKVLTILADVCWDLERLDEAIGFFQDATVIDPSAELVSLGLFHCLWESGRKDDAFSEMRRFLAENESEEYARLLKEVNNG